MRSESIGADRVIPAGDLMDLARGLLSRFPQASVGAVADNGVFAPVPGEVTAELDQHFLLTGHTSALELVERGDVQDVIRMWQDVQGTGFGTAEVHPVGQPDGRLTMYCVDTRPEWGVRLLVAVQADGGPVRACRAVEAQLAPRLAIVRKSGLGEFLSVDEDFAAIMGHSVEEMRGRRIVDLVHPDDQASAVANWMELIANPGSSVRIRLRYRHADGHWVWFEITNRNRLDEPDNCVVAEMIDISDEMAAHEELRANQQLLARLTDALPVGVVQVDRERRVLYSNARAARLLGSRDTETLAGMFSGVVTSDIPALDRACADVLERGASVDLEVDVQHPSRNEVRCRVTLRPLTAEEAVTGAIACIDDVTEPAKLRAQLEFRATYDALTGCLNRASLLAELERAIVDARVDGTGTAVVFIDLDGFKSVNDNQGHTAGDQVLQRIARQLTTSARRGDMVGRVGGDEFLVVGRSVGSAEQALAIAQRLAAGLAGDGTRQPAQPAVASIGVAWMAGYDDGTADQLIARADDAMYVSKRERAGRPVLG